LLKSIKIQEFLINFSGTLVFWDGFTVQSKTVVFGHRIKYQSVIYTFYLQFQFTTRSTYMIKL